MTDVERDLIIEKADNTELRKRLTEREQIIMDLNVTNKAYARELKKIKADFALDMMNIADLNRELRQELEKEPFNEAEARRKTLAIARIAMPYASK